MWNLQYFYHKTNLSWICKLGVIWDCWFDGAFVPLVYCHLLYCQNKQQKQSTIWKRFLCRFWERDCMSWGLPDWTRWWSTWQESPWWSSLGPWQATIGRELQLQGGSRQENILTLIYNKIFNPVVIDSSN